MIKLDKRIYLLVFVIVYLLFPSLLFAKKTTSLKEQAKIYRDRGLMAQQKGRLDVAMAYYNKAIALDPTFVIAYNDLGIIYEAKGWPDRAEQIYLAALEIDANYPNIYSNLAMLYEQKKDYRRAIEFWEKRVQLGGIDEAWLAKAQERIELLRQVVPELRQEYLKQEAERFARELSEKQKAKRLKELAEARRLFSEAKGLYQKTEYEKALNSLNLALALNTEDNELLLRLKDEINTKLVEQERKARIAKVNSLFDEAKGLYEKTEYEKALNSINLALALNIEDDEPLITLKNEINARIIEQEKQTRIAQMERYFKSAMTHYQQDNLEEAQRELDKISTEIASETSQ